MVTISFTAKYTTYNRSRFYSTTPVSGDTKCLICFIREFWHYASQWKPDRMLAVAKVVSHGVLTKVAFTWVHELRLDHEVLLNKDFITNGPITKCIAFANSLL